MNDYNNTTEIKDYKTYNDTGYSSRSIRPYPKKLQEILDSLRTECALQHASAPAIETGN